jgi:hypothetical protein
MGAARDLTEAHAFDRCRGVTALVFGAPGGHEAEPGRPVRTMVAGVALGVLLIVGAGARSLLAGPADTDPRESSPSPASASVSSCG